MERICAITTGRWDYSHLYWILKDMQNSNEIDLTIIAAGNHHCIKEIVEEFGLKSLLMAPSIENIDGYGQFYSYILSILKVYNPDIFLCLGDRYEVHAAATAACLLNIPIAHIHGGEETKGSFDNELRNSITMMSTYHFTANKRFSDRICNMKGNMYYEIGTKASNIYTVGAPGLDWINRSTLKYIDELKKEIAIDFTKPYVIGSFNPVTKELEEIEYQVIEWIAAFNAFDMQTIIILPNIDPGNKKIIDIIFNCKFTKHTCIVENVNHLTYLSLMKHADLMVGNSSSGIIEAASLKLPVVNIGTRQEGRIMPPNVVNCGYDRESILKAMNSAIVLHSHKVYENPYGDGQSSRRIVKILEDFI